MEIDRVITGLGSRLRREILSIVSEKPMTTLQVLVALKKRQIEVKYRETVYRALEICVDSGLLEKYYEKENGLCYKLVSNQITIRITKEAVYASP